MNRTTGRIEKQTVGDICELIVKNVTKLHKKNGINGAKNMPSNNESMKYVGSAWNRVSKNGADYISVALDVSKLLGELGYELPPDIKVNLSLFENNNKKSERSPDYSIVYFIKQGG